MLKDRLKQDSVIALKNHDQPRVDTLRFLISLIDKKELQLPPGSMDEAQMVGVLQKELKNKEESKEMFAKAGRTELVEQLNFEISLVKEYLPKALSEEELGAIVEEVVKEVGDNFSNVMRETMKKVAGRAGGDVVSRIVKEKLS